MRIDSDNNLNRVQFTQILLNKVDELYLFNEDNRDKSTNDSYLTFISTAKCSEITMVMNMMIFE